MKLTSFYAAPVCTPSRAQVLTGCYAKRVSLPAGDLPRRADRPERATSTPSPALLKKQGYATMCIGKWHVGDQPEFLPTRHGFDHYFGLPYSNDMGGEWDGADDAPQAKRKPPLPLVRDDKVIETLKPADQDRLTERYTDEAVKFIRDHKDSPFFLYLPHTAVHVPLHPGAKFKGKSANGTYGDWVEEADASTGRVLDTLRELKLEENTLVDLHQRQRPLADAGQERRRGRPAARRQGRHLRGRRARADHRLVARPHRRRQHVRRRRRQHRPAADVRATGRRQPCPADRKIDGADLSPLLLGKTKESPREAHYYFNGNRLEAVRSGPWKLAVAPQKRAHRQAEGAEGSRSRSRRSSTTSTTTSARRPTWPTSIPTW